MAKFFTADALDEEQIDYIENEFYAGFTRHSNHHALPEK